MTILSMILSRLLTIVKYLDKTSKLSKFEFKTPCINQNAQDLHTESVKLCKLNFVMRSFIIPSRMLEKAIARLLLI